MIATYQTNAGDKPTIAIAPGAFSLNNPSAGVATDVIKPLDPEIAVGKVISGVPDDTMTGEKLTPKLQPQLTTTPSQMKKKQEAEDAIAKEMFAKADKKLNEEKDALDEKLIDLTNPKKAQKVYNAKLREYARPKINIFFGVIMSLIAGLIAPTFGYLICANIFANMEADYKNQMAKALGVTPQSTVLEAVWPFILYMRDRKSVV